MPYMTTSLMMPLDDMERRVEYARNALHAGASAVDAFWRGSPVKGDYAPSIPRWVISGEYLRSHHAYAFAAFLALCDDASGHENAGGWARCNARRAPLAKIWGVSSVTVTKRLYELIDLGLIRVIQRGIGWPYIDCYYSAQPPYWMQPLPPPVPPKSRRPAKPKPAPKPPRVKKPTRAERWQAFLNEHGRQCMKCGATTSLTCDHIVPRIQGGPDTPDNWQVLCFDCNLRKRTKRVDYRPRQKPEVLL